MNMNPIDRWSVVVGTTANETEFIGYPVHVEAGRVVFESSHRNALLENLNRSCNLTLHVCSKPVYTGHAKLTNLVDSHTHLTCEAELEQGWKESVASRSPAELDYKGFLRGWEEFRLIRPEFKVAVAELQTYLAELRAWLGAVEQTCQSEQSAEFAFEKALKPDVFLCLNSLFEALEKAAEAVDSGHHEVHQRYLRTLLQPLVFAAPFAERVIRKPLGYAGDFEMVNMILRTPFAGSSLYGRLLHAWFVSQPPAEAHRNRINYLKDVILAEAARVRSAGRGLKCFSAGCGPAWEIQNLMDGSPLADTMEFDLLDFNHETLAHARGVLEDCRVRTRSKARLKYIQKSVVQLVKSGLRRPSAGDGQYDLVYCAGLFDYLPDKLCSDLIEVFYRMITAGGLVVVTNVNSSNPIKHWLASLLEWPLIYRDSGQMLNLCRRTAAGERARVLSDVTGVNLFVELRGPS